MNVMQLEKFLTPEQMASAMQLHKRTVLRWIDEGKLKAVRVGKKIIRIPESEAARFLKSNKIDTL